MKDVVVRPITTSKGVHAELAEALPVYDTTRCWLELQPDKIVEGCRPAMILKKLLETSAMFTEGNISESELHLTIYSLLS